MILTFSFEKEDCEAMSDVPRENRNDLSEEEKQAKLQQTLARMKVNNPSMRSRALREETPELRNTSINPRLLSQPQFDTNASPLKEVSITPQEKYQMKKEEFKEQTMEKSRQMENLKNILSRTREHPVTRKQQEETQRQLQMQAYQKQKENETLYLMALVGGFFLYHYIKTKF
jgi:hypothetical protein